MGSVIARRLSGCGILLVAWLVATGAVGTCPFFQPTAPETPNRPPIPTDYSIPTRTLETMARGMVDKTSNGQDVYMSTFAESSAVSVGDGRAYHAFFDLLDLVGHGNPDWGREEEPSVFNSLVQHYSLPFEMTWEPYEPAGNETGGGDDSLLHRRYRIVQVARTGNTIIRTTLAAGAADLHFVRSLRDPSKWVIAIWQDYHAADESDSAQVVTLGRRRLESRGL
jgi:hypothetical protein